MSVHTLSGGQETYYLREVAQGAEEYYSERGEVPGRWIGSLAESSGLVGEVDAGDLRSVLSGVLPSSDVRIARSNRKNAAIDVTLSAPKSVSVLWALSDDETARAVIDAHEHAVDVAVSYLEREASKARRGKAGWDTIDGAGLMAAAFRHRTSRLGDPQLHTHVLVANETLCADGQWRSLHAKYLFHHARTAGHLYQVQLRHGLAAALGVSWTATVKGFAEIDGIPNRVLGEFSQRRVQVVAEQARTGDHTPAGGRRAAKKTRPAKVNDVDYRALRTDWTTRARVHGFSVEDARRLVSAQREPQRGGVEVDDAAIAASATANRSTYERRQVLISVANMAPPSWNAQRVEQHADEYLAGRHAVIVGVSMFGITYSTTELIEIEQQLIARAAARNGVAAVCSHVIEILNGESSLSDEQRVMIETVTTGGGGVSVVVGEAGTGKTHALGVARRVWEAHGYTVIGAALAARAAANLQHGSGIPSCSLDRLLGQLDSGRLRLWCDTVLVIDEAAMVGTRKLDRILNHAHIAHAKVVLVGDHHQLPEIDAGGAFAALAQRLGAVTLHANHRQTDPTERAALAELRNGDIHDAVSLLAATGHIHQHQDWASAHAEMVNAWLDDVLDEGADSIMLAATRADVAELNQIARARLRRIGAIERRERCIGERSFAVGDWVMTTRNDYRNGVINGRRGVVTNIAPDGAWLTATVGHNGNSIRLDRAQLETALLDHSYAITIHRAQGLTCDTAHVLGDESLYREAAYTALSRGRHANHLHLTPATEPEDAHVSHDDDERGLAALTIALAKSRHQRLASIDLTTLPDAPIRRKADIEHAVAIETDWGIEI